MDAMKLPFGRAVRVCWYDSAHVDGWKFKHPGDIAKVVSIGFVTAGDDTQLTVSSSVADDTAAMCPLSIPWNCIVKLEQLGESYDRYDRG